MIISEIPGMIQQVCQADLRVAAVARVVAHSSPAASLSPSALESCADPAFLGCFFTIKGCALT
jgi:hypothetical protein